MKHDFRPAELMPKESKQYAYPEVTFLMYIFLLILGDGQWKHKFFIIHFFHLSKSEIAFLVY
jgi:hypothetical protein